MDFIITTLLATILFAIYYFYFKWKYSYWQRNGVPQLETKGFVGGLLQRRSEGITLFDQFIKNYHIAKSKGYKHIGTCVLGRLSYTPIDIEIVKCILQKDFNHFMNHGFYINEEVDPLSGNLFNLENERWRSLRVKLTPTFTSGKIKMMFPTLAACTSGLIDIITDHSNIGDAIDIKDVVSRFTTDVIGSCAFGIDCNSLKNPNSEFREYGNKIFSPRTFRQIMNFLPFFLSHSLLKLLRVKQTDREVESFFINMVQNTIDYREKNNIYRKDFMQLLLQLKNQGKVEDDDHVAEENKQRFSSGQFMTTNQIAAQAAVFFSAGFETSATTITFALLELALNQDIQEKLRNNILSVLKNHDNQLTYEAVMEMTYLDQVVQETLRKHPPVPVLPRICNKEYIIPGTNTIIKPGTRVGIPVLGIHRDPEYYPDPEKFLPERFSEENKVKLSPCTFLVFGEGPRLCIGARFAKLQTKVGLITIIKNFNVTLNEKTQIPIQYANAAFINSVKGGLWLNASTIK